MPANDLRRALDDAKAVTAYMQCPTAKNASNLREAGLGTLPNLKAVLREVARLHRAKWWAYRSCGHRIAMEAHPLDHLTPDGWLDEITDHITANSPKWRDAFRKAYDIDPKEIGP